MRGHHRLILEKIPHNIGVWSAAEKEKLKDLFREGYSDAEIGAKLGRTEKSVSVKRHHLGLHKAQQPRKEFRIHDAMADYYPKWYKKLLKQRWQEQQTSTK